VPGVLSLKRLVVKIMVGLAKQILIAVAMVGYCARNILGGRLLRGVCEFLKARERNVRMVLSAAAGGVIRQGLIQRRCAFR